MTLQVHENIVINEDGTPADHFVFSVKELINVGNYSSVTTFSSIGRYIQDNEEERQKVIDLVEKIAEVKRDEVIELIGVKS
jgi:thioredoxin-related protein